MHEKTITMMELPALDGNNFSKLRLRRAATMSAVCSIALRIQKIQWRHVWTSVLKSYCSFCNGTIIGSKTKYFSSFLFLSTFSAHFSTHFQLFFKKNQRKKLFNSNEIFNCLACIQFDCSSRSHIVLNENTGLPSHDQDSLPSTLAVCQALWQRVIRERIQEPP